MAIFSHDDMISLSETTDIITVDIEGMTRMLGFSVCFDGLQKGHYFPFTHDEINLNLTTAQQGKIYEILNTRDALTFHNAVHDLSGLSRAGFDYRGRFYDTMLMAHWVNEERMHYGIDKIAPIYGYPGKAMPPVMSFIIETEGWDKVPVAPMSEYGANDAYIQHGVFRKLLPQFQAEGFDGKLWDDEQKFIRDVMGPMMDVGIKIDQAFCINEYMKGIKIMAECKAELGFNPGSSKQLKTFLIDELGLPVVKHTKSCKECEFKKRPVATHNGPPSFDKHAMVVYDSMLEHKDDPRAKTILRYRGWGKTTSSNYKPYMDLCDDSAVLHPGYKLHGTKTGRLSCENPNLQQIPKSSEKEWNGELKKAFIPRDSFGLWEFDYSQLQFRMTVAYAKQMDLIEIFNDEDRDIFNEMAARMRWKRQDVKTLVYLILFGGGGNQAKISFDLKTVDEGKALVEEFHALYPSIRKIAKKAQNAATLMKYVSYWTGRRRHFFPNGAPTFRAFNAVIQGGEAEIMKRAMIALQEQVCDENCKMVLQIHDAIVFEIREGMEDSYHVRIKNIMETVPQQFCDYVGVRVRFPVEGKPWGEK